MEFVNIVIFGICAAFLYAFGFITGMGYQQASVVICIYVAPLVCLIPAVLLLVKSIKNMKRKSFNLIHPIICAFSVYSLIIGWGIYTRILDYYEFQALESSKSWFDICRDDLLEMANNLGISYYACNVQVYIVIPIIIWAFYMSIYFLYIKLFRKEEK